LLAQASSINVGKAMETAYPNCSSAQRRLTPWLIWQAVLQDAEGRRGVEQLLRARCDPGAGRLWVDLASFPSLWLIRDEERHHRGLPDKRVGGPSFCSKCGKGNLRTIAKLCGGSVDWSLRRCRACSHEQETLELLVQHFATKREIRIIRARLERLLSAGEAIYGDTGLLTRMLPEDGRQPQSGGRDNIKVEFDFLEALPKVLATGRLVGQMLGEAAAISRSEMAWKFDELIQLRVRLRERCGGRPQDAPLVRILDAAFRAVGLKNPVDYKYLKVVLARSKARQVRPPRSARSNHESFPAHRAPRA
jgi:hypothetical protein